MEILEVYRSGLKRAGRRTSCRPYKLYKVGCRGKLLPHGMTYVGIVKKRNNHFQSVNTFSVIYDWWFSHQLELNTNLGEQLGMSAGEIYTILSDSCS
jgi:hypothetical protein